MTPRSNAAPRYRRWKLTVATLAASATLLGGGRALAPATALAMVEQASPVCHEMGGSWFDQWCYQLPDLKEKGGGDGSSTTTPANPKPAPSPPTRGHEVVRFTSSKPKLRCGEEGVVCAPWGGNRVPTNNDRDSKPDPNDNWDPGRPSCRRSSPDREGVCRTVHGANGADRAKRLWAEEKERVQTCRYLEANLRKFQRWVKEVEETGMEDGEPPARYGADRDLWVDELQKMIRAEQKNLLVYSCELNPET